MSSDLLIILGVEGVLGSGIACQNRMSNIDIMGIDLPEVNRLDQIKYYISCDVRDKHKIKSTVDQIPIHEYDKIILISCIGKFGEQTFNSPFLEEDSLYESVQVNLLGISHFIISLVKKCLNQNLSTRIIVVGSAAANVGSRDVGYGISKAGLNGLVLSLSKSLASQNYVIIGVNPGIFESEMAEKVSLDRQLQAVESTHIKRKGSVNEIINFVTYLALDAPDYLTGSILNINGGQYT
ncbi:SDR family oxidoreductase [Microcoleus sp. A003_D6]|uniref:SDR family NAD(P)-dependent oxidoreductase n=1 Tax=Microcoleus sp. A003_D6 TaxID=3055266 RepID=UPI002FD0DCD4